MTRKEQALIIEVYENISLLSEDHPIYRQELLKIIEKLKEVMPIEYFYNANCEAN